MRQLTLIGFLLALVSPPSAHATDLFSDLDLVAEELRAGEPARRRAAVEKLDAFGPEARPLIQAALEDPDTEVRARAIASVGHHKFRDAATRLSALLGDGDARIRSRAAEALAQVEAAGSPTLVRSTEALERAATDHTPEVRIEAVLALGHLPPSALRTATPALIARLEDESGEVRRRAAEGLGFAGDTEAVVPLIGRMSDPSRDARIAVVDALAEIGDPRAAAGLVRVLDDSAEEVRAEAVLALGRLKARTAVPQLFALLSTGGRGLSGALSGRAAFALGRIAAASVPDDLSRPEPALEALLGALGHDATRKPAAEALRILGSAVLPSLMPRLIDRFGSAGEAERAVLIQLFSQLGDERATRLLVDELTLGRTSRETITSALAHIAKRTAGKAREQPLLELGSLASDPDPRVRRIAVEGLVSVADGRARHVLAEAVKDPDREVRVAAILALGAIGPFRSEASFAALDATVSSGDAETARSAAQALGAIGDRRATRSLLLTLARPEASVRRAAADALERLADPESRAPLLQLARSGAATGRSDVLGALAGAVRGRPDPTTRELCLALAEGTEEASQSGAVEVLSAMRDAGAIPRLLRLLGRSGSAAPLRRRVVAALGALPPTPAADLALVSRLKSDPDPSVRAEAAWALGESRSPSAEAPLVSALGSSDAAVRVNAAAALARLRRGAPALERSLEDEDAAVRANAAIGLGSVPNVRAALERLARTDGRLPARAAKRALSGLRPAPGLDWIALHVVDFDGVPLREASYRLGLPDGLMKTGRTDDRGLAREERLPSGTCEFELLDAPRP